MADRYYECPYCGFEGTLDRRLKECICGNTLVEDHITYIITKTVTFKETYCEVCDKLIQYHPDEIKPRFCKTCMEDLVDYPEDTARKIDIALEP
jgi:hypothetical protein